MGLTAVSYGIPESSVGVFLEVRYLQVRCIRNRDQWVWIGNWFPSTFWSSYWKSDATAVTTWVDDTCFYANGSPQGHARPHHKHTFRPGPGNVFQTVSSAMLQEVSILQLPLVQQPPTATGLNALRTSDEYSLPVRDIVCALWSAAGHYRNDNAVDITIYPALSVSCNFYGPTIVRWIRWSCFVLTWRRNV